VGEGWSAIVPIGDVAAVEEKSRARA